MSMNMYMAFMFGVQTGKAQTHTETIVLPPPKQHTVPIPLPPQSQKFPKDSLQNMSYTFSDEDEECLALNIYWEARDQDLKGKLAIGLVTLRRVKSKHYPDTICGVVWQRNRDRESGKLVAQFSWTLDGKSDTPTNTKAWIEAKMVASSFAGDGAYIEDFTKGAHLYHADYVNPYWKDHYKLMARIGSHLFYR